MLSAWDADPRTVSHLIFIGFAADTVITHPRVILIPRWALTRRDGVRCRRRFGVCRAVGTSHIPLLVLEVVGDTCLTRRPRFEIPGITRAACGGLSIHHKAKHVHVCHWRLHILNCDKSPRTPLHINIRCHSIYQLYCFAFTSQSCAWIDIRRIDFPSTSGSNFEFDIR